MRRDSYVSRKSISADADGPSNPALFLLPPPRAISLPSTQSTRINLFHYFIALLLDRPNHTIILIFSWFAFMPVLA